MARREVRQSLTAFRAEPVSFAGCVFVSAPSPASAPLAQGCSGLLPADLTPAPLLGRASCRCHDRPGGFSQLERREVAGPPKFPHTLSSLATLLDPGRPSGTSPLAVPSVLGAVCPTSSPPAFKTVSRLNCLTGVRLPVAAREVPCVRFTAVVRIDPPTDGEPSSPPAEQHSVLAGWLSLCISVLSFQNSAPKLHSEAD
jgi:hypothetical protein